MATTLYDVCGVRLAVVTLRRTVPGEAPKIENLCEIDAAEAAIGRSAFRRSSPGGGSLFDDFSVVSLTRKPRKTVEWVRNLTVSARSRRM